MVAGGGGMKAGKEETLRNEIQGMEGGYVIMFPTPVIGNYMSLNIYDDKGIAGFM